MSIQKQSQFVDIMVWVAIIFIITLMSLVLIRILPIHYVGWYFAISLATYLLYQHDKNAARNNSWRVAEATLHKLSFAGGWIGAAFAHKFLRHKSSKPEFRKNFYITVVGNLIGLGIIYYLTIYLHR